MGAPIATALTMGNLHSYGDSLIPHRMSPTELPLAAARWLFLANIVLTAWMYGGTREWSKTTVAWLLLANTGLFAAGLLAKARLPRVPLPAALAVTFLLIQGWFMTWNSQRRFIESARVFVDRIQPLAGWPGFMDMGLVLPTLLLSTGLLGGFFIACDLAQNPIWRDRLWSTLAATGVSLVILGLAQRLTEAPSIFWDLDRNLGNTFFAVFRYHANAGAFINLVLPLVTGLALRAWLSEGRETKRVIWTLAALLTAASGFVNVSRAANVICALLILGMGFSTGWTKIRRSGRRGPLPTIFFTVAAAALALALAFSFGIEKTLQRWEIDFWKSAPQEDGRYQAYEIIVKSALPAAGVWGFGPGTFEAMFDIHRFKSGSLLAGRWDMAHSDALQTPMEWGLAGAAAWLLILGGAFVRAICQAAKRGAMETRLLSAACAFSLGGVILHALVDFPLQIASLQLFSLAIAGLAWGMTASPASRSRKNKLARLPHEDKVGETIAGRTSVPQ